MTEHPHLASASALIGVALCVGLSAAVGFAFWWATDRALAVLTVGAELIAFGGLTVARAKWTADRRVAIAGATVTLLSALWCGMTMYQKIDTDSRAAALQAAMERPAYLFAANAARTAEGLLQERLTHPNPGPTCNCPQTIAAWEAAEGSQIDRLRLERDRAVAAMERATPTPQTDWIAIARGLGLEVTKLLGFLVFGLSPRRAPKGEPDALDLETDAANVEEIAPRITKRRIALARQRQRLVEELVAKHGPMSTRKLAAVAGYSRTTLARDSQFLARAS